MYTIKSAKNETTYKKKEKVAKAKLHKESIQEERIEEEERNKRHLIFNRFESQPG